MKVLPLEDTAPELYRSIKDPILTVPTLDLVVTPVAHWKLHPETEKVKPDEVDEIKEPFVPAVMLSMFVQVDIEKVES